MGTSTFTRIPEILKLGLEVKPNSILDIGPGFGKYGALFREYLDVWGGRFRPQDWKAKIDCVEAFPEYLHAGHLFYYNTIHKGSINNLIDKLGNYDLILWIDGPEHQEKNKGLELLAKLYAHSNKGVLIGHPNEKDPKIALSQGAANGNSFERHLSIWYPQDFLKYKPSNNGQGSVVLLKK